MEAAYRQNEESMLVRFFKIAYAFRDRIESYCDIEDVQDIESLWNKVTKDERLELELFYNLDNVRETLDVFKRKFFLSKSTYSTNLHDSRDVATQGYTCLRLAQFEQAKEHFEYNVKKYALYTEALQGKPEAELLKEWELLFVPLQKLTEIYLALGRYSEAEAISYHLAEQYQSSQPHTRITSKLLNKAGEVFCLIGEYEKALQYCIKAITIYEDPDNPIEIYNTPYKDFIVKMISLEDADINFTLGKIFCALKESDTAHEKLSDALETFKQYQEKEKIALCSQALGKVSQPQEALEHFNNSQRLLKEIFGEAHPKYASYLNDFGEWHLEQGNYIEAQQAFSQALHIYERAYSPNENKEIAKCYHHLGLLAGIQGNYQKQIDYQERALRIYKEKLYKASGMQFYCYQELEDCCYDLGNAYGMVGDYENQIKYLEYVVSVHNNNVHDQRNEKLWHFYLDLSDAYSKSNRTDKTIFQAEYQNLAAAIQPIPTSSPEPLGGVIIWQEAEFKLNR